MNLQVPSLQIGSWIPYEFYPALVVAFFVLGAWMLIVWRRNARERTLVQMREILHRERTLAMEKSLPLPAVPNTPPDGSTSSRTALVWFRMCALAVGLTMTFGGVGMMIGFANSGERDFRDLWTIGVIPAMAGVGLLVFYFISRKIALPEPPQGP